MSTDEKLEQQANKAKLESARGVISQAIAFLQQANATTSATGEGATSFGAALQDAVFEIDSQPDIVDPFLDSTLGSLDASGVAEAGVGQAFTLGSIQVPRKQGRLQIVRNLKVALFGGNVREEVEGVETTTEIEGLLEILKSVAGVLEEDAI